MYAQKLLDLCNDILLQGRERLAIGMGIVSRIENDMYEVAVVSSDNDYFIGGEVFPLKDTYCREVYEKKQTIALTEMDGYSGLKHHPLYENLPLEAYISSPIFVKDNVWGTLNFSSMNIRSTSFNKDDIQFNEDAAKKISSVIHDLKEMT